MIDHTFLPQQSDSNKKAEEIMGLCWKQSADQSHAQTNDDVCTTIWGRAYFEPSIYKSNTSVCAEMKTTYCVTDLGCFAQLLREGVELCLYLNRVVYKKGDNKEGESPSLGKRQLTSAKGNKSGRTTSQSGRASASKVCACMYMYMVIRFTGIL